MSDETQQQFAKQPYSTPTLVTYGNIATLTQALNIIGTKADGGGKLKTKSRAR